MGGGIYIITPDGKTVDSKDQYIKGSIFIINNDSLLCGIKGRGNSTWSAAKKPCTVKFDKRHSLYGYPQDKNWVLLANYYDPSFVRNETAFFIGRYLSKLDYTPKSAFSTFYLNDRFQGLYQLSEKKK